MCGGILPIFFFFLLTRRPPSSTLFPPPPPSRSRAADPPPAGVFQLAQQAENPALPVRSPRDLVDIVQTQALQLRQAFEDPDTQARHLRQGHEIRRAHV